MGRNDLRWIKRNTINDGEVIYDSVNRNLYLDGVKSELYKDQEFLSLPTFDARAPIKAYFDFTYYCNLECRHCITNSSPKLSRQNDLSSDRIISVMDELATIGVLEIGVGGGEPLCRSDILFLLSYAGSIGINTVLTTNGILVIPDVARQLKEIGVSEVRVSFDGSPAVHDDIRGTGIYHKTLDALRILLENGINAVPRLTICNDEKIGLEELFKDLVATGATSLKASLLFPRGRAALKENRYLFKYPRDNIISQILMDLANKYNVNLKLASDLVLKRNFVDEAGKKYVDGWDLRQGKRMSCGAGFETAYIAPDGTVLPCSGMPKLCFGYVKSDTFLNSWASENAEKWRKFTSTHNSWFLCGHRDTICTNRTVESSEQYGKSRS